MKYVIQHNLLNNDQLMKIRQAVKELPHIFVGLIPFSREITSNEPLDGLEYIPYGSTSFVETALERKWRGLSFDPDIFTYEMAEQNREDMLNSGRIMAAKSAVLYLRQAAEYNENVFIRPSHDLKQFSGNVMSAKEAYEFLEDAMKYEGSGSYKIDPKFKIVIAPPVKIEAESRWFIVDKKIIDGSYYRVHGQLHKAHCIAPDKDIKNASEKWLPHDNCVMDIAHLPDGKTKVLEFNCINGSGFYDHDIERIMTELYRYYERN